MSPRSGALPEELVKFVQVLTEDDDLRGWFETVAALSEPTRAVEFQQLAARMGAAGEHAELVQATSLLAHPWVFRAVEAALRS